MSGFLFNFFINDLIEQCLKLNIGAKIGQRNVSVIAYCDDILLMSPTSFHINVLIDTCFKYAKMWKMEFNPTKSSLVTFGQNLEEKNVNIKEMIIPQSESMIYLGFPIGENTFLQDYIKRKFKKVKKVFIRYIVWGASQMD